MARVKNDSKQRELARTQIFKDFCYTLDNMIIISSILREKIKRSYLETWERCNNLNITKDNWSRTDTWVEYQQLKNEIEMLSIFSNNFTSILFTEFYKLGDTFNPYTDYSTYKKQ